MLASLRGIRSCWDETEGALTVDDAEVDRLGDGPLLPVDLLRRDLEEPRGGLRVDIGAGGEGIGETADSAAEVGEDPQLDLRVVGADEHPSRGRDEGPPDSPSFGGSDRDVLQIGIGGGQPPGGGRRL